MDDDNLNFLQGYHSPSGPMSPLLVNNSVSVGSFGDWAHLAVNGLKITGVLTIPGTRVGDNVSSLIFGATLGVIATMVLVDPLPLSPPAGGGAGALWALICLFEQ